MDAVAASLWFAAACLIFCHYPQAKNEWIDEDDYYDDEEEEYERSDELDHYDGNNVAPVQTMGDGHVLVPMMLPTSQSYDATAGQASGEAPHEQGLKRMEDAQLV